MNVWLPVAGYLLGSIPFAYLLARRLAGVDVRWVGSGNVGATNVMRAAGPSVGLAVALLDLAKGSAAVWLAGAMGAGAITGAVTGAAAVLGHVYPVWLRFRGGKGVAVAAGVFAVLAPLATAIALAIFAALIAATRYVSLGSMAAAGVLPLLVVVTRGPGAAFYASIGVAVLILFRHRGNIRRLLTGTERRLGEAV